MQELNYQIYQRYFKMDQRQKDLEMLEASLILVLIENDPLEVYEKLEIGESKNKEFFSELFFKCIETSSFIKGYYSHHTLPK